MKIAVIAADPLAGTIRAANERATAKRNLMFSFLPLTKKATPRDGNGEGFHTVERAEEVRGCANEIRKSESVELLPTLAGRRIEKRLRHLVVGDALRLAVEGELASQALGEDAKLEKLRQRASYVEG